VTQQAMIAVLAAGTQITFTALNTNIYLIWLEPLIARITFVEILLMSQLVEEFNIYRTRMNEVILSKNNLVMKRLWNLDTNTYEDGALNKKIKEMLGLVASMVLRCDDCIKYHLGNCHDLGVNTNELYEIFAVANIVGGTIVIPHTRRAAEYWEELLKSNTSAN
jgi:AhpD family alkylhydroperoxidase